MNSTTYDIEDSLLYYVYPDGSIYSSEDYTLDELILSGHSDDCKLMPLPIDASGEPYIPENLQ